MARSMIRERTPWTMGKNTSANSDRANGAQSFVSGTGGATAIGQHFYRCVLQWVREIAELSFGHGSSAGDEHEPEADATACRRHGSRSGRTINQKIVVQG